MSDQAALPPAALALTYANRGYRIFPCGRDKRPLIPNGFKGASLDPDKIQEWWAEHPNAMIGLPTGDGLCVVDLDIDKTTGEAIGEETAKKLGIWDDLQSGLDVRTPSGGRHYYFKGDLPSSAGKIGPGIDTRGKGGYIIAPHSQAERGRYQPGFLSILEADPRPLPACISDLFKEDMCRVKALANLDPGHRDADTEEEVLSLVRSAPNTLHRDDWIKLCQALKGGVGDAARSDWITFSERYQGDVAPGEAERVWDSARPNGSVTLATVFHLLGQPPRGIKVHKAHTEQSKTEPRSLGLISFKDDLTPVLDDAWLIEDILPDQGLGALFGPPKTAKTFVALDLSLAIAGASDDWRGKYVEHGSVLYFGMEGGRLFSNRLAAYAQEKGHAPHFHRSAVNLDLRSTERDAEAIVAEAKSISRSGTPVRLIVVDTLNRAMAGGNENGPDDMGSFVTICESIRKEVGCYLLVIHHTGKDKAQGLRGHSSLFGAVDTVIELDGSNLTVTEQRDGESGLQFGYKLRPVELGISPRGKKITSCVIDATDITHSSGWEPSGNTKLLWEALLEHVADHGTPNPSGTGWPSAGRFKTVDEDAFRHFAQGRFTGENARRSYRDALKKLQEHGWVSMNEGRVWPSKGESNE